MSDITPPAPTEPTGGDPTGGAPADSVTPPAVDPVAQAEEKDNQEWGDAAKTLFPGISLEEDGKDEPAKPKEGVEEGKPAEGSQAAPTEGEDGKPKPPAPAEGEAPKEGDEGSDGADENGDEEDEPDTSAIDARLAARESEKAVEVMRNDVREKLFPNQRQYLADSDGDPIRTIDDVMKLINPRTQQPFTEEEAGMWLLHAQNQFNRELADQNKEIERVADLQIDIKDQSDSILARYGELFKEIPGLKEKIWNQFKRTLKTDSKSNIILDMPIPLAEFYEEQLEPYAEMGRRLEAQETASTEASAKAEADAKAAADAQRNQQRQDRSDIYGPGKIDDVDDEDKEWQEAAKKVFGDQLKKA